MQGEDKDDRKSQGNVDFIHERCQNHMQTRATGTRRETKHNRVIRIHLKCIFRHNMRPPIRQRHLSPLKFMKTFRNAAQRAGNCLITIVKQIFEMSGRLAAHIYNKKKWKTKDEKRKTKKSLHVSSSCEIPQFHTRSRALCLLHKTLFDRFTSRLCFLSPAIPTSAEFYWTARGNRQRKEKLSKLGRIADGVKWQCIIELVLQLVLIAAHFSISV